MQDLLHCLQLFLVQPQQHPHAEMLPSLVSISAIHEQPATGISALHACRSYKPCMIVQCPECHMQMHNAGD